MRNTIALIAMGLFCTGLAADTPDRPHRTILFIIDGLHWEAPHRLELSNFNALRQEGTYYQKACLLMPYHPLSGDWAKLHNSSLPNPIMLAGSLFITPDHKMVQEMFPREALTAHSASSTAYVSIDRGCDISFIDATTDENAVNFAIQALRNHDIRYMRIHLQNTGTGGWQCANETADVPWRCNIWGDGSPYVRNALRADALLGSFVTQLTAMDKWKDTLLIVTADHGQAVTGWHPTLAEDSWYTPLVFVGPGVAAGVQHAYAEHIDIVPTICHTMGIESPSNQGNGRVLDLTTATTTEPTPDRPTLQINQQLVEYSRLKAQMLLGADRDPYLENVVLVSERRFFHLDRFTEWYQTGDLDGLITTNQKVLDEMQAVWQRSAVATAQGTLALHPEPNQIAFENALIGYRSYNSGWGLDVFGKTAAGRNLTLRRFFKIQQPYIEDYHKLNDIGMDILHVGNTPALGGIAVVLDGVYYAPDIAQSRWEILAANGPMCRVQVTAPLLLNDETLLIQRRFTLSQDSRFVQDRVTIYGNPQTLSQVLLALGLTIFSGENVIIDDNNGFAISHGPGTEDGVAQIGLVMTFSRHQFQAIERRSDCCYVLQKPLCQGNSAEFKHGLTAFWDKDHTVRDLSAMLCRLETIRTSSD